MAAMASEMPEMIRKTLTQSSTLRDSFRMVGDSRTLVRRLLLEMTTRRLGPMRPTAKKPSMDPVRKTANPARQRGDLT